MNNVYATPIIPGDKTKRIAFIKLSKPAKKLCEKYDLRAPIDPRLPLEEIDSWYLNQPIHLFIIKEFMISLKNEVPEQTTTKIGQMIKSFTNDNLVLILNADYPREWLREAFNEIIHDWVPKPENRNAESEIDIWKVYDLRISGISYPNIAKEIFKKRTDDELAANIQSVKRAFIKATKIIKAFEKRSI